MPATAEVPASCVKLFCPKCGRFLIEVEQMGEARVRSICGPCGMDVVLTCYPDTGEGKIKPRMLVSIPVPSVT